MAQNLVKDNEGHEYDLAQAKSYWSTDGTDETLYIWDGATFLIESPHNVEHRYWYSSFESAMGFLDDNGWLEGEDILSHDTKCEMDTRNALNKLWNAGYHPWVNFKGPIAYKRPGMEQDGKIFMANMQGVIHKEPFRSKAVELLRKKGWYDKK